MWVLFLRKAIALLIVAKEQRRGLPIEMPNKLPPDIYTLNMYLINCKNSNFQTNIAPQIIIQIKNFLVCIEIGIQTMCTKNMDRYLQDFYLKN